jgi:hypothetical protein
VSLPQFRDDGWLPEGHHSATWEEIVERFGGVAGSRRATLLERLLAWRDALRQNGVIGQLVLDGSFVSTKENPGDCDCFFVFDDANGRLDDRAETYGLGDYVLLKEQGLGDVFVFPLSLTKKYPEFFENDMFDRDKLTGRLKGVVEVII